MINDGEWLRHRAFRFKSSVASLLPGFPLQSLSQGEPHRRCEAVPNVVNLRNPMP
jgi:hypothetical protein